MDLEISPDVDAYWCYGLVLALGIFTGYTQVKKHLGKIEGIWFVNGTWVLLALYSLIPPLLYWLLDLTGAINDTAILSAVVIGLGYERILTGGSETIRAPGDVSKLWTPLLAYANSLAKQVGQRVFQLESRLDEHIIAEVTGDPVKFDSLLELLKSRGDDTAVLLEDLAKIDANAASLGDEAVRELKARRLYNDATLLADAYYLMKLKGVIDGFTYFWYVRGWRGRTFSMLVALVFFIAAVMAGQHLVSDASEVPTRYDLWRIAKEDNSRKDQFRAQNRLSERLQDPARQARILNRLALLLQDPGLQNENARLVLEVMVRVRPPVTGDKVTDDPAGVALVLIDALRTPNAHNRDQTNQSLVYLADKYCVPVDTTLKEWNPEDGDTIATVERHIDSWRAHWLSTTPLTDPKACETRLKEAGTGG